MAPTTGHDLDLANQYAHQVRLIDGSSAGARGENACGGDAIFAGAPQKQREFFLGAESALMAFIAAGDGITGVA
jgi:hypothetical protein